MEGMGAGVEGEALGVGIVGVGVAEEGGMDTVMGIPTMAAQAAEEGTGALVSQTLSLLERHPEVSLEEKANSGSHDRT